VHFKIICQALLILHNTGLISIGVTARRCDWGVNSSNTRGLDYKLGHGMNPTPGLNYGGSDLHFRIYANQLTINRETKSYYRYIKTSL
jgi:hypothetical protein